MNKQIFNYTVIPSVFPADKESTFRIHPLGDNVKFVPDVTYTVTIREVETACAYYDDLPAAVYQVTPNAAGDLELTHTFRGEQRHVLIVDRPECDLVSPYKEITGRNKFGENISALLNVYSLHEDLYGLKGYKGEVHCHTNLSDGIQDIYHTVGNYRSAGYDFLAITDHYISFGSEMVREIYADAPVDMTLLFGEEVHVPNERIHTVHLGGHSSVNQYFRDHREEVCREVEALAATLDFEDKNDKVNYAWHCWIAEKGRELGGISILAHPHWIWYDVYFVATSVTQRLLRNGIYDALDIRDSDMETSVALWNELRAEGLTIPVVGSTDSHYTSAFDCNMPCRGGYTLVFAKDRAEESLTAAIKNNLSVCVNTTGTPDFVHGTYRLVKFSRFLLDNYYPYYMWLCRGQGVILSEYATADDSAKQCLALQNDRLRQFNTDFYGF